MRQWLLLGACAFALAGCQTDGGGTAVAASKPTVQSAADIERSPGYKRPADAQALASAKKTVAAKLKDPDSAKFTDLKRKTTPNAVGEPTDTVCGKVNAKNSYGGYTGGKAFMYTVADNSSVLAEDELGAIAVKNFCPELL